MTPTLGKTSKAGSFARFRDWITDEWSNLDGEEKFAFSFLTFFIVAFVAGYITLAVFFPMVMAIITAVIVGVVLVVGFFISLAIIFDW